MRTIEEFREDYIEDVITEMKIYHTDEPTQFLLKVTQDLSETNIPEATDCYFDNTGSKNRRLVVHG